MNLTQLERIKSELKRINGGGKTMDDKTVNMSSSTLGLEELRSAMLVPRRREANLRWELDETVMDSRKRIYHDVENDEGSLLVVVAGVGTRPFGRKSSSESSQERKL
jgi:hypothetical protein